METAAVPSGYALLRPGAAELTPLRCYLGMPRTTVRARLVVPDFLGRVEERRLRPSETFSPYGRKTQIKPAQLTLVPVLVTVAAWAPAGTRLTVAVVGLIVVLGVATLMAPAVRSLGRRVERQLHARWVGDPASRWMLCSDSNLDERTKARYRACLEQRIDGWVAPSQADEEADREGALSRYDTAVRWLRERTRDRDRFGGVFQASVSYGLRRNAYGARWVGRTLASLAVIVNLGALYYATRIEIDPISIVSIAPLLISMIWTGGWLKVVRERWVRDAADAYARALLATCDSERS